MPVPVVTLRQLERQMARDKDRAAENLKASEDQYQQQVARLQQHAKAVEKERNLLMVLEHPLSILKHVFRRDHFSKRKRNLNVLIVIYFEQ